MYKIQDGRKTDQPSILIKLPRIEKSGNIYPLRTLVYMKIRVEPQRIRASIQQCHRYQQFNRNKVHSRSNPRCIECGKVYLTNTCNESLDQNATCASFGGPHPVNYRRCRLFRKHIKDLQQLHKQDHTDKSRKQKQFNQSQHQQKAKLSCCNRYTQKKDISSKELLNDSANPRELGRRKQPVNKHRKPEKNDRY